MHKSDVIDINVDGGRSLHKLLACCNYDQPAKVYELPTFKAWKRLYFLDECVFCGRTVAYLQECDKDGNIKILKRFIGKRAIEFRDKILKTKLLFSANQKGSLVNERTLYNNSGDILNFNGRKVTTNEEILKI